ncbi:MAG: serine/threonine protein phosphatase PrpC [Myxococcota bacterium]|jgi:serine/threonine protein phosphatase PrpC
MGAIQCHGLTDVGRKRQHNEDAFATAPQHNLVLRAVGTESEVLVDTDRARWQPGDVFVLCSDGLNGELTHAEIQTLALASADQPEQMAQTMIAAALERGARDNVTVVVARVPQGRQLPFRSPTASHGTQPVTAG